MSKSPSDNVVKKKCNLCTQPLLITLQDTHSFKVLTHALKVYTLL